jgi:hypothetical protein
MKITESHLRVIIKEELNSVLNEMDVNVMAGPFGGRGGIGKSNKKEREERKAATDARHDRKLQNLLNHKPVSQEEMDYSSRPINLGNLAVELINQDKNYVERFLSVDKNNRVKFESFVGKEFKKEFQDLANKAAEDPNLNKLEEFKKLAKKFAPVRAGEGFGSKIARGLSTIYSPSTKE